MQIKCIWIFIGFTFNVYKIIGKLFLKACPFHKSDYVLPNYTQKEVTSLAAFAAKFVTAG